MSREAKKLKSTISCSRCIDPGMCCRAFPLNETFPYGSLPSTIMKWLRSKKLNFFRPLRRSHVWTAEGKVWEQWQFNCTRLLKNGRCGAYKDRPELCKVYEPGSDMMCVHVRGLDGRPIIKQKRK